MTDVKIERGYLAASTGQIHYRTMGQGRPLLLLHQSPLSSCQFQAVLPLLAAAGFHAVALDMPGFGMSDSPPAAATFDHYVSCIPAALQSFGWRSAALVGHHSGAVIAALFAAAHAPQVSKLVLNGLPLLTAAEQAHFATFKFGPTQPTVDGTHLLTAWQNRLRSTPGWTDLELMHRYTVEGLVSGTTNWKLFPLIIQADLSAQLQALRMPTLLLTNTGEDLYAATRRAHALRPDFAYRELLGGTHDIIDEQPAHWARAVIEFLAS